MDFNLKIVFLVLLLSSFVEGLFSFVTPFYLTSIGISLIDIGLVFSIAALAMVMLKLLFGGYTDIRGRRLTFAFSSFLEAISSMVFPFVNSVLTTAPAKILYDLGSSIRLSLKSTIIFENAREAYKKIVAWFTGAELLMTATVNFGAVAILSVLAFRGSYFLMAVIEFISFVIITATYKERPQTERSRSVRFREMYDLHLSRNMWVIMLAIALSTAGMRLSHSFAEPLYFQAKYGLSESQIGIIIGLHRLSLALPLFVTGAIMHRLDTKRAFVLSTVVFSFLLFAMGLTDNVSIAVSIWLLHDILGGSIRVPAAQILIQLNARDDKRGKDVNTMDLLSGLMAVITPSLTGLLITIQWDLIFLVGGLLAFLSSLVIYLFYR